MASAAPSSLASSVEKTNGAKLSRLLIDGGTTVLRSIFDRYHPPASLSAAFFANYLTLNNLLKRRILHRPQWDLLFPPSGAPPDSQTFDITLLFLLLTNICGLFPPRSGWHTKPPPGDISLEANLARIKFYRNELYGHVSTTGIDTPKFSALWQEISVVLVRLGLQQAEIDRLKAERCGEEDYIDALLEWADSEEDIKSQLRDIRDVQTKVQQIVGDVRQTQLEDHGAIREGKAKLEEVHQMQTNLQQTLSNMRQSQLEGHEILRESKGKLEYVYQTQLENHQTLQDSQAKLEEARQTQLEDSSAIQDTRSKVDEVHERLQTLKEEFEQNIEDLKSEKERLSRDEILRKLAKIDTSNDVKHHAARYVEGTRLSIFAKVDRWLDDEISPNRVMVISGNAGMGKSVITAVLCKKMLEARRLSGSQFCQHNKARRRNPKVMLQSLACQLCDCLPDYKNALVKKLSRNLGEEINDLEVRDLFELLFEEPLQGLSDPGLTYLIVIDGLDESEYQGRNELLDLIANYFEKLPLWIRFLVTTRPQLNLTDGLKRLNPLHLEPNNEENLRDIQLFFTKELRHMLQSQNQEIILKELVEKTEGVMLYAYYLVDFIKNNVSVMTPGLMDITLPSGISSVYQSYFERLETDLRKQLKVTEEQFLNFLCAVAAAREPLPLGFVSKLLLPETSSSADYRKLRKVVACVSTLLPIEDDCIHFFHKSIKDWLIEKSSYWQHSFSVDETECHCILAKLCTDELDEIKRKGVDNVQFSDTTKYALQHGVKHLLELEEDTRACSLEGVVTKYVVDVELLYAKLCVNSTTASEDILCVQKQQGFRASFEKCPRFEVLGILLLLLRKHNSLLTEFPQAIFQTLLNDGGAILSSEALNLLKTKFSELSYMECLHKNDQEEIVQTRFQCSAEVACFDVSPQLNYMVCQCHDNKILLWSLETGKLLWTRSVEERIHYLYLSNAFRWASCEASGCSSFYRSVVFHPTEHLVLAGTLSYAYTFDGVLKPLFPSSQCTFSVCSVSSQERAMLTDCPDNAKCIIMWSLIDGAEISRFTGSDDMLSFACSRDGRLLAISDSAGCVTLVDTMNRFNILAKAHTSNQWGMIKFSPDCRYLFGTYCSVQPTFNYRRLCLYVKMGDNGIMSLDVVPNKVYFNPWEYESCSVSGFLLGDPVWHPLEKINCECPAKTAFAFVLNTQSILSGSPKSDVIEILTIDERTKDRASVSKTAVEKVVFSCDGDILYVVNGSAEKTWTLTAWDIIGLMLKAERSIYPGYSGDQCIIAAVRKGILFQARIGVLELWNAELSECIQSWTNLQIVCRVFPITEERVALEIKWRREEIILDTSSGDIESINHGDGTFLACNRKCHVVRLKGQNSLQLQCGEVVLWKTCSPFALFFFPSHGAFSPTERIFVIWGRAIRGHKDEGAIFVFDAVSGRALRMLPVVNYRSYPRLNCMFMSDEKYLVSTDYFVRLFNVNSGELLSVIAMESIVWSLTVCPVKRLVALGLEDSKHGFKIIQVKQQGDKDDKKNERSAFIY